MGKKEAVTLTFLIFSSISIFGSVQNKLLDDWPHIDQLVKSMDMN